MAVAGYHIHEEYSSQADADVNDVALVSFFSSTSETGTIMEGFLRIQMSIVKIKPLNIRFVSLKQLTQTFTLLSVFHLRLDFIYNTNVTFLV